MGRWGEFVQPELRDTYLWSSEVGERAEGSMEATVHDVTQHVALRKAHVLSHRQRCRKGVNMCCWLGCGSQDDQCLSRDLRRCHQELPDAFHGNMAIICGEKHSQASSAAVV